MTGLIKSPLKINFAGGTDTKTDPNQVPAGRFLSLVNMNYTEAGALTKRNGYSANVFPAISGSNQLASYSNALISLGSTLSSYSPALNLWENPKPLTPITLSTQALVRGGDNLTSIDSAVAGGLTCSVYTELNPVGDYNIYYQVIDQASGQTIVKETHVSSNANVGVFRPFAPVTSGSLPAGTSSGGPRVFVMGGYFVIIYVDNGSTTALVMYLAIPVANPTASPTVGLLATPEGDQVYDGFVLNNVLYVTFSGTSQVLYVASLNTSFATASHAVIAQAGSGSIDFAAMCADANGTQFWLSYITRSQAAGGGTVALVTSVFSLTFGLLGTSSTSLGGTGGSRFITLVNYSLAANSSVSALNEPTAPGTAGTVYDIQPSVFTYPYAYAAGTVTLGTISNPIYGLAIASKPLTYSGNVYIFCTLFSANQPTYFLMPLSGLTVANSSKPVAEFAYSNAGTNYTQVNKGASPFFSTVTVVGNTALFPYLYIDLVTPSSAANATVGVYGSAGGNLITLNLAPTNLPSAEAGLNLNFSSGVTFAWDGNTLCEQTFFYYPDRVTTSESTTTGATMALGTYLYQVIYEWTDNRGNVFNSAPSIPVQVTLTTGDNSAVITISSLNQTYKPAGFGGVQTVNIKVYRYSAAQPVYYLTGTVSNQSNPNLDTIFKDTNSNALILGNEILYTTGGTLSDDPPPSFTAFATYDSRLWGIDAEDPNLLWFSKQLIETAPVEWSSFLTYYVPPVIGIGGNTGPITGITPMDDKFIVFKKSAIYYIVGAGPDNTGANSQYSSPQSIVSTVGTTNPSSIVVTPNGIMFQSDKGIWLLGRDLSTSYIGAPVEAFNSYTITSAQVIPGTTQVRFTTNQPGFILVFDYYFGQWAWFTGITTNIVYSTAQYQNLYTFIDTTGTVYQETPGAYIDGASNLVTMSFQTGWLALQGLQGFQRAYQIFLLGQYLSAHTMTISAAYNYAPAPTQTDTLTPAGSGVEQYRLFLTQQKCEAIQITAQENLTIAGAGLSLSGMILLVGAKRAYPKGIPSSSVQ